MQYDNIYFFKFWEYCVLKGHKWVQKIKIWVWKRGVKNQLALKSKLNQNNQKGYQFYLWNHKFNVFKRFWKQKKSNFLPAKKSLIKAQFGGENGFFGHFSSVYAEVAWFGCDFCGHLWGSCSYLFWALFFGFERF